MTNNQFDEYLKLYRYLSVTAIPELITKYGSIPWRDWFEQMEVLQNFRYILKNDLAAEIENEKRGDVTMNSSFKKDFDLTIKALAYCTMKSAGEFALRCRELRERLLNTISTKENKIQETLNPALQRG